MHEQEVGGIIMDAIEGLFELRFSKRIRVKIESCDWKKIEPPFGWFSVSSTHFKDKTQGETKLYGQIFKISTRKGEDGRIRSVYRYLKMSPNLKKQEMLIDWSAQKVLLQGNKSKTMIKLKIRKARWYELPKAFLSDPDPIRRSSGFLGTLSFCLGALSFFLAIISIIMAF